MRIPSLCVFWLFSVGHATCNLTRKCSDLADKLSLPNTTVWFTESIPAGANVSFPDNDPTCGRPYQQVDVDICRVATLTETSSNPASNISLEAWLPSDWNGRFLSTGNGGLSGCIQYEDIAYGVSRGFATVGANNGHNGTSGQPFYQNPGALENFVYRSVHLGAVLGKQIAETYYARAHDKSYYLGCSTGGRQGFKAAQEFPTDFDGIVAGAPAFAFANLTSWSGSFYTISGPPGSPTFLTQAQWARVSKDFLDQCDDLDGLVDGIIEDPNLCHYRPEALLCGSKPSTDCLSGEQAETVRKVFSDLHGKDGALVYPRLQPGGDASLLMSGYPFPYTGDWFRYVVYSDAEWDPSTLGPEDYAFAASQNPFNVQTWEGDLAGVRNRGAKILHYHGLQDPVISSDNSERYYNHVARTMGLTTTELDHFYRYFRISGMSHCSGGAGAYKIGNVMGAMSGYDPDENVLSAIVRWVEDGLAPDHVKGTGETGEGETFARNHCKYPLRGRYTGKGDPKSPDSWECV
ncbi:tannase and feruloyl esterase [Emericellopsis atlantica]|uniref:Carboxylic ester hydrolase n=1 Tax=Emericellopsis atlantica TaxID=2614577 RepID=A0A9P7ZIJ0_9HYPO|nr:tannase and feruloyl esterase [Emericellopsis atlantica]KAG9252427.1 tannase and feruloyl esterase [Emericellopsis atlantica]